MAKVKPAKAKKSQSKWAPAPGAIPCLVLILLGLALFALLFYAILRSAA